MLEKLLLCPLIVVGILCLAAPIVAVLTTLLARKLTGLGYILLIASYVMSVAVVCRWLDVPNPIPQGVQFVVTFVYVLILACDRFAKKPLTVKE